jgi:hypothetical protein
MLPQIAQGGANKVWIIPSEITQALGNIGAAVESIRPPGSQPDDGAPEAPGQGGAQPPAR